MKASRPAWRSRERRADQREVQELLRALREGEVDAVVAPEGDKIRPLRGATYPYQAMVEAMAEGALTVSRDGAILYCNEQFAQLVGRPPDRTIGAALRNLVSPADTEKVLGAIRSASDAPERVYVELVRGDGRRTPASITLRSLARREIPAVIGVVSDLTEVRRNEAQLRLLQNLVEAAPTPFVVTAPAGRLLYANRAYEQLTGYSLAELRDKTYQDLTPERWHEPEARQVAAMLESGKPVRYEKEYRRKDGSVVPIRLDTSFRRDPAGTVTHHFAFIDDLSERKRTEEALARLTNTLADAQRIAHLGSWDLDLASDEVRWSDEVFRIYGMARRDGAFPNAAARALNLPEDQPAVDEAFKAALAGTRPFEVDHRIRRLDGVVRRLHCVAEIQHDDKGRPQRVLGTVHDITEQWQATEALRLSEEMFRRSFDEATIGKALTRPDGTLVKVNEAFARMLGYGREELQARGVQAVTHPDDRAATAELIRRAVSAERATDRIEKRYVRKDGGVVWADVSTILLRDAHGAPLHFVTHIVDITERKRAEEEVRSLNATLEQRIAQRTAELENANKDLEGFAYSVSHDLRAPLRAIDSFSRIVLDQYAARLDAEGQRLLGTVRRNTETMGRLINDMLAFSRAGRAELARTEVDMGSLAREILAELGPVVAPGRSVDLRLGDLPRARADHALMRQVLANLIGNALKFTGPRPAPIIEISGAATPSETTYTVRDNGVGFDPAYTHKLFGVFQRLHSTDEFPGTGIGLAIVKRIVEKHGGRVWAEGKVGEGATFGFALPAPPRGGTEEAAP